MTDAAIYYRAGYKYQLAADYHIDLPIVGHAVQTEYLTLTGTGQLVIRSSYCWDGASGPTWDTRNSQRASLTHDALYQLMRLTLLPRGYRNIADHMLHRLLLEDGMSSLRAGLWWRAVQRAAGGAARPSRERPILVAP